MAKPYIHAQRSARRHGGKPSDYEHIHAFMDCSKGAIADNRHRALTHNSWFLVNILERIKFPNSGPETPDHRFPTIINSDGQTVSVRDIGEEHCLEDFANKFIPSAQDYLSVMEFEPWMQNGLRHPPSFEKIHTRRVNRRNTSRNDSSLTSDRESVSMRTVVGD